MATTEEMRNDRFFMMKVGRFITSLSYEYKRSDRYRSRYSALPTTPRKPWYEHKFDWDQVADSFVQKSNKYTAEEVKNFFLEQQAAAKLEDLLDGE